MNLPITINSLQFKKPSIQDYCLSVKLSTSLGSSETLRRHFPQKSFQAIISETLYVPINIKALSTEFLSIEIINTTYLPQVQSFVLDKKTWQANDLLVAQTNKFTHQGLEFDIKINRITLKLDYRSIKIENYIEVQPQTKQEGLKDMETWLKEQLVIMGEGSQDGQVVTLLQVGQILQTFVKEVTPLAYAYYYILNLITWKKPLYTLILALSITIFLQYPRLTFFLFCLTVLLSFKKILESIFMLSLKSRKHSNLGLGKQIQDEDKKLKSRIVKRNLQFLADVLGKYNQGIKFIKKAIKEEDKTWVVQVLEKIKAYIILLILLPIMLQQNQVLIFIFWLILLKCNPNLYEYFLTFEYIILSLHENFIKIVKWKPKQEIQAGCLNSSKEDGINQQILTRTFVVWENQRQWLISGWGSRMLPGERNQYSDADGVIDLNFRSFQLPGPYWEWIAPWETEINELTDKDGWMYGTDFKAEFWHPYKKAAKHIVRRRKWVKKCKFMKI